MIWEILNALAALATIGGFVFDLAERLHDWLARGNTRMRMEREEVINTSENE